MKVDNEVIIEIKVFMRVLWAFQVLWTLLFGIEDGVHNNVKQKGGKSFVRGTLIHV